MSFIERVFTSMSLSGFKVGGVSSFACFIIWTDSQIKVIAAVELIVWSSVEVPK